MCKMGTQTKWLLVFIIVFLIGVAGAACVSNYKQAGRVEQEQRKFSIYQDCVEMCILFSEDLPDLIQCVNRCGTFDRKKGKENFRPYIMKPKNPNKELMKGK